MVGNGGYLVVGIVAKIYLTIEDVGNPDELT